MADINASGGGDVALFDPAVNDSGNFLFNDIRKCKDLKIVSSCDFVNFKNVNLRVVGWDMPGQMLPASAASSSAAAMKSRLCTNFVAATILDLLVESFFVADTETEQNFIRFETSSLGLYPALLNLK